MNRTQYVRCDYCSAWVMPWRGGWATIIGLWTECGNAPRYVHYGEPSCSTRTSDVNTTSSAVNEMASQDK